MTVELAPADHVEHRLGIEGMISAEQLGAVISLSRTLRVLREIEGSASALRAP